MRRACILFQLNYKQETDFPLMQAIIRENLGSKEFFINKAIGWALRQYTRIDPQGVRKFVAETPLNPLSAREALGWLKKRGALKPRMKILVFLHGTAIMHAAALGRTRGEQRVQQVLERPVRVSVTFASYVPTDDAVAKTAWPGPAKARAFCTSVPTRAPSDVAVDRAVLARHGFPDRPRSSTAGRIATYADGRRGRALPDVLIEDDCESIGGEAGDGLPCPAARAAETA